LDKESGKLLLSNLGLNIGESEVYSFIARHPGLKCSEISKRIGKNRTIIFRTLRNLESEGMVERTANSPARFTVVPIGKILDLSIARKQNETILLKKSRKDLLDYWNSIKKTKNHFCIERFAIIEGRKNIYPKMFQMIEKSKKEILIFISDTLMSNSVRLQLNECILRKSSKKNVKIRLLNNAQDERSFHNYSGLYLRRRIHDQVLESFLEPNLNYDIRFVIRDCDDAIFFSRIGNNSEKSTEEACFWSNSEAMINILRVLFEKLWVTSSAFSENSLLKDRGYSDKSIERILKWYA
jgi:sugar-specific transcriptional regulator TrmB